MKIFITGTDTNVGKTIISAWLALHTGFAYWKPIQTGSAEDADTKIVTKLSSCATYPEIYSFQQPLAPYFAAQYEGQVINLQKIIPPLHSSLLIEGAGGLMVPLTQSFLMIDLIQKLKVPVILVARSTLGTINHTCLSIEALKKRNIPLLGVIMNGPINEENRWAIEEYAQTKVLAQFPLLSSCNFTTLHAYPLPVELRELLTPPLS